MDEELKSIQSDLDDVLGRLADYMSSDRLQSPFNAPQESGRDEAIRTAFCYAKQDGCRNLESAIHISRRPSDGPGNYHSDSRLSEVAPEGSALFKLMAALRAIDQRPGNGWPLDDSHMESLWVAVSAWASKECSYLGESAGLTLSKRREVDPKRWLRETVAWEAFALHLEDPERYPVGEGLFELVGRPYGMSSSVVKRAYYSENPRKMRDVFKETGLAQWSDTDEN